RQYPARWRGGREIGHTAGKRHPKQPGDHCQCCEGQIAGNNERSATTVRLGRRHLDEMRAGRCRLWHCWIPSLFHCSVSLLSSSIASNRDEGVSNGIMVHAARPCGTVATTTDCCRAGCYAFSTQSAEALCKFEHMRKLK